MKQKTIHGSTPFSKQVTANNGKMFLELVDKHFHFTFHKIFNSKNLKIGYSCVRNKASIIQKQQP